MVIVLRGSEAAAEAEGLTQIVFGECLGRNFRKAPLKFLRGHGIDRNSTRLASPSFHKSAVDHDTVALLQASEEI
jgi:hypothetical protein